MEQYPQPLRNVFFSVQENAAITFTETRDLIATYVRDRDRDAALLVEAVLSWKSESDLPSQLKKRWRTIVAAVAKNRVALERLWFATKNDDWVRENDVRRESLSRVSLTEWRVFERGNPFILLAHGVSFDACKTEFDKHATTDRTPVVLSYYVAFNALRRRPEQRVSVDKAKALLAEYGVEWTDDALTFDPSLGFAKEHALWDDEFADSGYSETFAEAKTRVPDIRFPDYDEFRRLHNTLRKSGDYVCSRDALEAEKALPELIGTLIWNGLSPEEKQKRQRRVVDFF